ncbi:hypothetical protein LCGC14_2958380 [marine sediment metagenome]|uniref:Uncharacterized protein n=1 Tax=marine sediment metagenome TaxID=412755 RepID=A0A0F8ZKR7_9ZZZZ
MSVFIIYEKSLDVFSTSYLYIVVAKDINEASKIADIDIPNDYHFRIIGNSNLHSQVLLECSRDIYNHMSFELGDEIKDLI